MIINFGIWGSEMEYCNNHHGSMKSFRPYAFVLIVFFGIAGVGEAIAKEYFVAASNGNDKNYGTIEAPFFTLEKGVSLLLPGDTLYIRGGTYTRNHKLWEPPNGISWENATTIKAYQNEKVIIKSLPGTSVFRFKDDSQYIIMDGLTVDGGGPGHGLTGYTMGTGSHHLRIINGEVKNTNDSALLGSEADYIEIINMKLHDSWQGTAGYGGGEKSYGFYLNGDYNLVQDCEIYNSHGYGIHMYSTNNQPSHNRIINNRIHDNDLAGIIVTKGINNQVINNVFWNNARGIEVLYDATNTIVYHNTSYSNSKGEILLGDRSSQSIVKNNLLVGTNTQPVLLVVDGTGASKIENNLILGVSKNPSELMKIYESSAIAGGNLIGDSYRHGLKKIDTFDFHITETSSAIGAGLVLADVKVDMDGVSRNSTAGYDIGAYQFGGGISQEPPTSLRIVNK
ncbi:right-handed parallel beta-helix repeat-containing protein [Candidatus Nitrospira allomarina]|uniref:Right-handed parallel beta-helix repeat-containing protein n=1 Tax=Candidatus Nitrospira allomarina TaxID=3020900 RepID=A0AA96JZ09_9BACT|nr:right-handed parallel beta-helix repeat-containing protein [Candidatus Nitrospira allomarina]WNM58124.1 right-handed parallel beta-helix repeat-containing protein [Candidatus Nitrospira allomarina]